MQIKDQLLYTTMKLTVHQNGVEIGSGTGFFYNVSLSENEIIPVIITNKHVVDGADLVVAICHISTQEQPPSPSGEFVRCEISLNKTSIIDHPDEEVDLCAIPFAYFMEQGRSAGRPILFQALHRKNIPSEDDWENFSAIEEVIMPGCPRGLYDEANNLPIVRRGTTASSVHKRYNGKDEFVVDMACFPGSSGSPVFLLNENGYLDRKKNSFMFGVSRFFFLGVLYSGPVISNSGRIILGDPKRVEVGTMMHLGYVLRSSRILELEDIIKLRAPA